MHQLRDNDSDEISGLFQVWKVKDHIECTFSLDIEIDEYSDIFLAPDGSTVIFTEPVSTQQRRPSPRRVGHSRTNLWHRSSNQACLISPFTHINPLQPYPHHPLLSNFLPSFQVKYLPADKVPDRETTTKTGCSKTYRQACSSCHATS